MAMHDWNVTMEATREYETKLDTTYTQLIRCRFGCGFKAISEQWLTVHYKSDCARIDPIFDSSPPVSPAESTISDTASKAKSLAWADRVNPDDYPEWSVVTAKGGARGMKPTAALKLPASTPTVTIAPTVSSAKPDTESEMAVLRASMERLTAMVQKTTPVQKSKPSVRTVGTEARGANSIMRGARMSMVFPWVEHSVWLRAILWEKGSIKPRVAPVLVGHMYVDDILPYGQYTVTPDNKIFAKMCILCAPGARRECRTAKKYWHVNCENMKVKGEMMSVDPVMEFWGIVQIERPPQPGIYGVCQDGKQVATMTVSTVEC